MTMTPSAGGNVRPLASFALPSAVTTRLLLAVAALASAWYAFSGPHAGRLVNHFHISRAVAGAICTLIASGSFWTLAWLYPFVVPVEITLATFLKVLGTAYVIGW